MSPITLRDHPAEAAETEGEEGASEEGASKESDSSDPEHGEGYFTGWDGLDDIHELSAEEEIVDEEEQGHGQPFEGARAIALLQRSPWLPAHFKHWKAQAIQAPVFPASTTNSPMRCRRRF